MTQDTTQTDGAAAAALIPPAPLAAPTTPAAPAGSSEAEGSGSAAPDALKLAALAMELEGKLAALRSERDLLADQVKTATKLAADMTALSSERDTLRTQVETMTKTAREGALLDRLYSALPGASKTEVSRMLKALADEGKADRYTDNPDKTSAEILGILKIENSALLRTPVNANGSTNPQTQLTPQDKVSRLFGARR
jgi:hypothetical protein